MLKTAPAASSLAQLRVGFWRTWRAVENAKPGMNRFAITHKALGAGVPVKEMSAEQLARCIEVFSAIKRDHEKL